MAKIVTNQGKQNALDRYANINSKTELLSFAVDDSTTLLSSATTTLNSPSNLTAVAFDSVTRSGQTLTIQATFGATAANYTHRRLTIHNIAFGSVTGTSATVNFGHDQQSIVKNSSVAITYTIELIMS